MGLLIGIGLGGTAISIPMSVVGKHFPLSTRTIAMSIVTAMGLLVIFFPNFYHLFFKRIWMELYFIYIYFILITGLVAAYFVNLHLKLRE